MPITAGMVRNVLMISLTLAVVVLLGGQVTGAAAACRESAGVKAAYAKAKTKAKSKASKSKSAKSKARAQRSRKAQRLRRARAKRCARSRPARSLTVSASSLIGGTPTGSPDTSTGTTPPPATTRPAPVTRPFSPASLWNAPLAPDVKLDPLSDVYAASLRRQVQQYGPYVNTTAYSTPVYTVPETQPMVRVKLDQDYPRLQAAFDRVPIPPAAVQAAGTDANMVIWQPSTDTMWEFYRAARRVDGWHAFYGGKMTEVSTNPGHFKDPPLWGATATSIPLLAGLIRLDELAAGKIDHALAIAIPEVRAKSFSYPAMRTDGTVDSPTAIPEGARFRIDPNLDLSRIPMAPIVRQMAEAAQRHGMVVRDRSKAVVFFAEDPTPTGRNPYLGPRGYFGGQPIWALLKQFPWAHVQATQTWMFSRP